jgi:putative endopeptidase
MSISNKPKYSDDFYKYINYEWLMNNKIPDDEIRYTHFLQTQMNINDELKNMLENNEYPLATQLFKSYLNENYKESNCLREMMDILSIVDKIISYPDLISTSTLLLSINVNILFDITIDSNIFSSSDYILYINQPSVGLPNKKYYKDMIVKQKYYNFICQLYKELFTDLSNNEIEKMASLIIDIETKLSIILMENETKRNINDVYHQYKYDDVINIYPKLYLKSFFDTLQQLNNNVMSDSFKTIIMEHNMDMNTNYFKQLERLLHEYSVEQWKNYFKYQIIISYMHLTTKHLKDLHFDIFIKTIKGQKTHKPLLTQATSFTCTLLYDPLSRIFAKKHFDDKKRKYMEELVNNIKKSTHERIIKLSWMGDETKQKAITKLEKIRLKLSYSESNPRDYNHVTLNDSIILNTILLRKNNFEYALNKINKKIDPNEWNFPSFIVNALYNPTQNEIIFPMAIMFPPFLDLSRSDIYNYANIGSVIAHEIIHAFDDQGSRFDENGNINNWWDETDKKNFKKKVNKIIEIYDSEGVNGKLTAGENIADFGSVVIPLHALNYKSDNKLTLDNVRNFYKYYAEHWQYLLRTEAEEEHKLNDPHSSAHLRVNIPLKHQKTFQKVFNIKSGNKMFVNKNDMLTIW